MKGLVREQKKESDSLRKWNFGWEKTYPFPMQCRSLRLRLGGCSRKKRRSLAFAQDDGPFHSRGSCIAVDEAGLNSKTKE